MRVVVYWSGGKECCLAYQKMIAQGHEVAYLLTYVYMEPYIFHSLPVMELQSKTLGTPQLKVKILKKKSYGENHSCVRSYCVDIVGLGTDMIRRHVLF